MRRGSVLSTDPNITNALSKWIRQTSLPATFKLGPVSKARFSASRLSVKHRSKKASRATWNNWTALDWAGERASAINSSTATSIPPMEASTSPRLQVKAGDRRIPLGSNKLLDGCTRAPKSVANDSGDPIIRSVVAGNRSSSA
jgi:hypothetical protein